MDPLIYFSIAVVIAIGFTAIICRRRTAHKKSVSYGSLLSGAFGASLVTYVGALIYLAGDDLFTLSFWQDPKQGPSIGGFLLGVLGTALPCALASLAVVAYYQLRQKHAAGAV